MKNRALRNLASALILAGVAIPGAMADRLVVGVHGGTQGLGLNVTGKLSDRVHVRALGGRYSYDDTVSTDEVTYDGTFRAGSLLGLVDWYPTGGGFRVSAGVGWNDNELEVTAPLEDLARAEIPDLPPLDFDLGTAVGTARGDDIVPVVLLGWGNPFRGGRVNVSFDVGVLYQGKPDVTLEARTDVPIDAIPGARELVDAAIAEQERALESELDEYAFLPVVNLSVGFRF